MQKEIGSIFPISKLEYEACPDNLKNIGEKSDFSLLRTFSLCREALLCIAKNYNTGRKAILLPAYTCQTVIDPFLQEGFEIHFFPIDNKLCIKESAFLSLLKSVSPGIVLFHPYYGKKLMEYEISLLKRAKNQGALIICDLTQSIFAPKNRDYVDITVGSMRKWLGIPDGAFMLSDSSAIFNATEPEQYNESFTVPQMDAMYLRGEYFRTGNQNYKQISIRLNKYAEGLMKKGPITFHKMSDYSTYIMNGADMNFIRKRRIENFGVLLSSIKKNDNSRPIINSPDELDSAPLYFPVYVKNREYVQRTLADQGIYAPVLWPVENNDVLADDAAEYIYSHLLAIPVDQRYDCDDMQRIADAINAGMPNRSSN